MSLQEGVKTSGTVTAVNNPWGPGVQTVDVDALGTVLPALRFPAWYAPQVGDVVLVDWLGSQPYVAQSFAGVGVSSAGSYWPSWNYSSPHTGRSTCLPAVGSGGAMPFLCARRQSWSAIQVEVTAAAAGGVCRLGVYADNGHGTPGALIIDAGAVPTSAVGMASVSFNAPFVLPPGLCWLGFQIEGAAATLRSVTGTVNGLAGVSSAPGSVSYDGFYSTTVFGAAGAMPNPFPSGVPQTANLPFIVLTAS